MSKLVVLPALAALILTATVVTAGCTTAPTEEAGRPAEETARPTASAEPLQETATAALVVPDTATTPSTVPTADDELEFVSADSPGTAAKDEGITLDGEPSPKNGASTDDSVQGQAYTWEDSGRTLTVYLQTDMVVEKGSDGLPRDAVAAEEGGGNIVRGVEEQSRGDTLPVFRSESGELLTLPGGVLLVLDPEWSEGETNSFLSVNGIKADRVSELSYATNGFFIEAEPGYPSLDLANALAGQEGVELASPNWGRGDVPK